MLKITQRNIFQGTVPSNRSIYISMVIFLSLSVLFILFYLFKFHVTTIFIRETSPRWNVSHLVVSISLWSHGLYPSYSVHGILQTSILEWVAISFSRGSSQSRDQTRVFRIAGGLFTIWVTREAPLPRWTQY